MRLIAAIGILVLFYFCDLVAYRLIELENRMCLVELAIGKTELTHNRCGLVND